MVELPTSRRRDLIGACFSDRRTLSDPPVPESVLSPVQLVARYCRTTNSSIRLGCRTYCDGTGYGTDQSPYWGLLFEKGA